MCNLLNKTSTIQLNSLKSFFVEDIHRLIYCAIPKVVNVLYLLTFDMTKKIFPILDLFF